MVLSDQEIEKIIKFNRNNIRNGYDILDSRCINPTSIDIRLGDMVKEPKSIWYIPVVNVLLYKLGYKTYFNKAKSFINYTLYPGRFALFHSLEYIEVPRNKCACIFLKSSMGRIGLEHNHSAWIDAGFKGQLTLELINEAPYPLRLTAGERIAQLVYFDVSGEVLRDYSITGNYYMQTGATPPIGLTESNYDHKN